MGASIGRARPDGAADGDNPGCLCYAPPSPQLDPWCSGPTCQPVTLEIAGSNPVGSAILAFPYAPSARPDGAFLCPARCRLRRPIRGTSVTLRPVTRRPVPVALGLLLVAARGGARRRPARARGRRRGRPRSPGRLDVRRRSRDRRRRRRRRRAPRPAPSASAARRRPPQPTPAPPAAARRRRRSCRSPNFRSTPTRDTAEGGRRRSWPARARRYDGARARRRRGRRDPRRARRRPPGRPCAPRPRRRRRDPRRGPRQEPQAARLPARGRGRAGGPRPGLGRHGAVRRRSGQDARRLAADRAACPRPAAADAFDPATTWTLFAGGDILLDRGVYLTAQGARAPTSRSTAGPPTSPAAARTARRSAGTCRTRSGPATPAPSAT